MNKDIEFELQLEENTMTSAGILGEIMNLQSHEVFSPKRSAIIEDFMQATNNYKQIMMEEQEFKTHRLM